MMCFLQKKKLSEMNIDAGDAATVRQLGSLYRSHRSSPTFAANAKEWSDPTLQQSMEKPNCSCMQKMIFCSYKG